MKTVAWTASALLLFAAGLQAQVPPPAAGDDALRILNYVPAEVDGAILVRMDALAATDLWKRFNAVWGLAGMIAEEFELALDFEKDVSAGVFCFQIVYQENGEPGEPLAGGILALARDLAPQAIFKDTDDLEPVPMPGISTPVYRIAPDTLVALPDSRTVVVACPPDYLAPMLTAATTLYETPPWPRPELAVPGECAFAGRMPEKLKAAIRSEFEKERRRLLKPNARPDRVLEFAFLYNLVALALDAEVLTGSLNLADSEAALRATLLLGEGRLAAATASAAQALADPLAIALPAAFGGMPLAEPPAEPLYLVQADGREIRVTMSRPALEQLVVWMTAGVGDAQTRSALNLREIGRAVAMYRADHAGAWPAMLAALLPYLADPGVLVNPARADPGAPGPGGDYQLVPLTNEAAAGQPWAKVLAFEILPPERMAAEGLLVLFADGHVDRVAAAEFNLLYQQTLRSLGR